MIHHAGEVVQLIEQAGVLVYCLPPCSPDLNSIEEAFSKVKFVLKSNEETGMVLTLRQLF